MGRFDIDQFVECCVAAVADRDPESAVRDVVLRAVSEPRALELTFPTPLADDDDDGVLHRSADLLVANAIFPRRFNTGIHDHAVAAVIGVWAGYEDNHLFERVGGALRPLGVQRLTVGEVLVLGADAIHDVHTPLDMHSAALHVYLGDITTTERSSWDDTESAPSRFDGMAMEQRWQQAAQQTGLVARPSV